ncbi:hypothetical protein [Pelagibacterium limicola]|uniref:hypothetical protein n=1 Tax=Pelagibacterium limicola TaxID=2791022 RepID=UPI0018AF70D2|nr:hypothetical protein [Pelagibacterium limicola]
MTAAERLAALEELDAATLCDRAETALAVLVEIMNRETTLLRAGHMREAAELTADKTKLAQDYVTIARAVQRVAERLKAEAPLRVDALRRGHEALATQMAENLRVLATARNVTENLLADVARQVSAGQQPKTYSAPNAPARKPEEPLRGISIDRAL